MSKFFEVAGVSVVVVACVIAFGCMYKAAVDFESARIETRK